MQEDFGPPWKRPSPLKAGCRERLLRLRLARRAIGAATRRMRNAQWATRCGRTGPVEAPISEAWEVKEAADCRIQYEHQQIPQVIRTNKRKKQRRRGGAENRPLFRVLQAGGGQGAKGAIPALRGPGGRVPEHGGLDRDPEHVEVELPRPPGQLSNP
ncbi:hypothetical protein HispidOSU_018681 [Sigmodon hispidus]